MKGMRGGVKHPKTNLPPLEIAAADRVYYRERWGFDPDTDRTDAGSGRFRYEVWFPLCNDPELSAATVEIGARVEFDPKMSISNRIVFRSGGQGGKEAEIPCTHVALYDAAAGEIGIQPDRNLITPAQQGINFAPREASLPPWEHFVALKSWVAAIAEMGLGNLFRASRQSQNTSERKKQEVEEGETEMAPLLPFGFNAGMQAQVTRVLNTIAPLAAGAIIRDFLLEMLDDAPKKWVDDQIWLLAKTFAGPGIVGALEARTRQDPGNPYTWRLLGLIQSELALQIPWESPPEPALALHDAAKQAVVQATTIDPLNAGGWADLGRVIRVNFRKPQRSLTNNLRQAVTAIKRALKIDPRNARWWAFLGEIQSDMLDPASAVFSFEQATSINPQNADFWDRLGVELSFMKDNEGALRSYKHGLQINPRSLSLLRHLIDFHREREEWIKVIEICQPALIYHPRETYLWEILGEALEQNGQDAEALFCFEKRAQTFSTPADSSARNDTRSNIIRGLIENRTLSRAGVLRKKGIQPVAPPFVATLSENN